MPLSGLDYLAAGAAAVASGAVNSIAGGGTLISFPTLVAIGVKPVPANITNTVSLLPGYLAGSWAQRDDLRPQLRRARLLAGAAAAGGLAGSVLLVLIPEEAFRAVVPYLILLACALLFFQDRLRALVGAPPTPSGAAPSGDPGAAAEPPPHPAGLLILTFLSAAYGGFFGAGLGILLLAVLGLFIHEALAKVNALKQALSFVVNLVAGAFFLFSGKVVWSIVPVMAIGSLAGGYVGGRLVFRIAEQVLRSVVVLIGVAVAIGFWVA